LAAAAGLFLCGLPGLCMICIAATMPFELAGLIDLPYDSSLWLGLSLVGIGIVGLGIPILIGLFALRRPRPYQPPKNDEPLPPPS
jgi:hypothetical protein